MQPSPPPSKGLRFAAERASRRRAKELRAAALTGGMALLVGGLVAAVDAFMRGAIAPVWSLLFILGGAGVSRRALYAPRSFRRAGLQRDLLVFGGALMAGALLETLHGVGALPATAFHLGFAASIGTGAALLVTLESSPHGRQARVVGSLRVAAFLLALSAATRVAAVGIGEPHGNLAGVSMLLLATAGIGLVRAATRTPVAGWAQL